MPEPVLDRRAFVLGALCVFVAGGAGCGYLRANVAEHNALVRELDAYAIPKPLAEVWPSVTLVSGPHGSLDWSGLGFTWKDTGKWKKRTSVKSSKEKGAGGDQQDVRKWYVCEGIEAKGGSQVRYHEHRETTTHRGSSKIGTEKVSDRRFDLEIELIRRFDKAAADRIEAAGKRARASA
jgi:hypothetical protein